MQEIIDHNVINLTFARDIKTKVQNKDREIVKRNIEKAMKNGSATQEEGMFFIHLLCEDS